MTASVVNSVSVRNTLGATYTNQPIKVDISQHLYQGKFDSLGIQSSVSVALSLEEAIELYEALASVINEVKSK